MKTLSARKSQFFTTNIATILIGSALLLPTASYAAVDVSITTSSCAVAHVIRHFGPPSKGFDRIVTRNTCSGVEFPAFNLTNAECSSVPTFRRVGPRDTVIVRDPMLMKCGGTVAGIADTR